MVLELLVWIFCYERAAVMSFAGNNYCKIQANRVSEEAQLSLAAPVLSLWLASGRAQWCWDTSQSQPPVFLPAFPRHIPRAWDSGGARGALAELVRVWQEPVRCSGQSGPVAAPTAASAQG